MATEKRTLRAQLVPRPSVVGGCVALITSEGRGAFQILLVGTTEGVTKPESDEILGRIANLINEHGLEIWPRKPKERRI